MLREDIPVHVYLPPCYESNTERYPVLYLLHGYPYDETHWLRLGIDELVTAGITAGAWPPFLMVMPLQPQPLFTGSDGGPGSYEEEFLLALVPAVERRYRVIQRASARGLAGISRGGVWALEIGFRNPEVVGALAALSPALEVNLPRPPYDPLLLAAEAERLPGAIFIAAGHGEPDVRKLTTRLSETLESSGIIHRLLVVPGGHVEETWQRLMGPMMMYFVRAWTSGEFADWPPPTQDAEILVQ